MKRFLPAHSELIRLARNLIAAESPFRPSSRPLIAKCRLLNLRLLLALSVAMTLCSCRTSLEKQFHTGKPQESINIDYPEKLENDVDLQMHAQDAFIEHYEDFTLGTIEFNDEGLYFSDNQRLAVNKMITKEAGNADGIILVVFIHGWKHNATVCDSNVACFRNVLQFLGKREVAPEGLHRRVIGVYLGWRGLTLCNQVSEQFTILNRKGVGESLGANQARRAINDLLTLYSGIKKDHIHSRFVAVGHSLGGGVLFSAVGPMYRQALKDAINEHPKDKKLDPIRGFMDATGKTLIEFPDLVVLANPAFEAELYRPTPEDLARLDKDHVSFSEQQLPLLLSISSTGDTGTRLFFPIGETIKATFSPSTWIQGPFYLLRNIITAANYRPYVTDTAMSTKKDSGQPPSQKQRPSNCFTRAKGLTGVTGLNCGCDEVSPKDMERLLQTLPPRPRDDESVRDRAKSNQQDYGKETRAFGRVTLTRKPGVDKYNPFLVVTAKTSVIQNHDDIFNINFLSLLMDLLIRVDDSKYASEIQSPK